MFIDTTAKRIEKQYAAAKIVAIVRSMSPPGRFLMKNKETGLWEEIGDDKAREKASQTLRDGRRKEEQNNTLPSSTPRNEQFSKAVMTNTLNQMNQDTTQKAALDAKTQACSETNFDLPPTRLHSYLSISTIEMGETIYSLTGSIPDSEELFRETSLPMSIKSRSEEYEPLNFLLNVQDMQSLPNSMSYSDMLPLTKELTMSAASSSKCRLDLMSDDLDFEINIPGIGEDTFANFPREYSYLPSNSCQNVSLGSYWQCTTTSQTDDLMSVLSRLYSDVSISLIRSQTNDSMHRNYNSLTFGVCS
jgi:hypothetical protein